MKVKATTLHTKGGHTGPTEIIDAPSLKEAFETLYRRGLTCVDLWYEDTTGWAYGGSTLCHEFLKATSWEDFVAINDG